MKFTLKNIGLIKNSEIKLDGLTVITGHNNSGKTTVGKALYACIEGASDVDNRFEKYKVDFLKQLVAKFSRIHKEIYKEVDKLISFQQQSKKSEEIMKFIHNFFSLFTLDSSFEEDCYALNDFLKTAKLSNNINNSLSSFIFNINHYQQQLEKDVIFYLSKLDNVKHSDFIIKNIEASLQKEFANQIQPVKNKSDDLISEINIIDDIEICKLVISNNKLIDEQSTYRIFNYNKVFLIDNPFILDELRNFSYNKKDYDYKINLAYKNLHKISFINTVKYMFTNDIINYNIDLLSDLYTDPIHNKNYTHNHKLKIALSSDEFSKNVIKKIIDNYSDSIKKITKLLNSTIPGEVIAKQQEPGFEYIHKDYRLNLSNLATGTKLFAIMKMLISKEILDNETMLILDEPESHLHPEWQNIFAELLVLLVKDVDCRILLTTHSPNFLLAIEAFMYKHNIIEKCNFYKTQFTEDNEYVDYVLSNNTNEIYGDFVKFLSQVKEIRNTYANLKGDIDNEH